jgi:hypothetical protein
MYSVYACLRAAKQVVKALVAAFITCTLPQRPVSKEAASALTAITTTTTAVATTVTATSTTACADADASTDVVAQRADPSDGSNGSSTQYTADSPVIKVKLEKAKVSSQDDTLHLEYLKYSCIILSNSSTRKVHNAAVHNAAVHTSLKSEQHTLYHFALRCVSLWFVTLFTRSKQSLLSVKLR